VEAKPAAITCASPSPPNRWPRPDRPLDTGIEALWLTPPNSTRRARHRSRWSGSGADYLAGARIRCRWCSSWLMLRGIASPQDPRAGMSGSRGSSVASTLGLLLRSGEAGRRIVHAELGPMTGSGDCRAEDDRRDAVAVCGRLGCRSIS
jgi:hypothetical protein